MRIKTNDEENGKSRNIKKKLLISGMCFAVDLIGSIL